MIKVGETTLISDQVPLMLCDGELCLNANNGKLSSVTLSTHIHSTTIDLESQLKILLNLRKFNDAWETCKILNATDNWLMLGNAAISDLDIAFGMSTELYELKLYIFLLMTLILSTRTAIKVFRFIGNAAVVFALKSIQHIEDVNYLSGYCALLLDKPDKAKTFFAKSANPQEALEICKDLLQWEQAIVLAETLDPDQIPFIAREYAQQLEFT